MKQDWRHVFRWMAKEFHWTPDQVSKLTLYQIKTITCSDKELGGIVKMSRSEARDYLKSLGKPVPAYLEDPPPKPPKPPSNPEA